MTNNLTISGRRRSCNSINSVCTQVYQMHKITSDHSLWPNMYMGVCVGGWVWVGWGWGVSLVSSSARMWVWQEVLVLTCPTNKGATTVEASLMMMLPKGRVEETPTSANISSGDIMIPWGCGRGRGKSRCRGGNRNYIHLWINDIHIWIHLIWETMNPKVLAVKYKVKINYV